MYLFKASACIQGSFVLIFSVLVLPVFAQPPVTYTLEVYEALIDSMRAANAHAVQPEGDPLELAAQIALAHYPELRGNKILIKYKASVKHPITASWAFGNVLRFRSKHTYVLLVYPDSFVTRLKLNYQIGVIGHEMAHFTYYRKRPAIYMVWWGLKYVISRKFRREFERSADFATVDHGLAWQLIGISFYTTRSELEKYLEQKTNGI